MKNESIVPSSTSSVAINEISPDHLLKEMSEWSTRIAQRAYDFFAASGFTNGHDLEDWLKAEQQLLKPVTLEVKDSDSEVIVKAEVPGFDTKDLNIRINGSHLVIEGKRERTEERQGKDNKAFYSEQETRQIYRTVALPAPVVAEKAHAEVKNGVLELKLPKAQKPKEIKVAAAA
jgi:HSP20 family protein